MYIDRITHNLFIFLVHKDVDMYQKIKDIANIYSASLVVVSKTRPNEQVLKLYNLGQRHFAENRVQSLLEKKGDLPNDISWHIIGHLQTNKVKYIVPFVYLIHSVDSLKLWKEIDKEAKKQNRVVDILFQLKIAEEDSKFGFDYSELQSILTEINYKAFKNTRVCGVMGMATFTDNVQQIRSEFKLLHKYFTELRQNFFEHSDCFQEISMGMSSDYQIALEEGSTILRVGSILFE